MERFVLAVLSSLLVGAAVCDGDGRVLMADEAYGALFGVASEAMVGVSWEVLTHPEDRERTVAALDRQRHDGRPFELSKRIVREDGAVAWVQNRVSRLGGDRILVLSRPLPEELSPHAGRRRVDVIAFAGVVSETASTLGHHSRRLDLPRTADLLEEAADAAIPEATG